jgi:hypothetical protein
VITLDNKQIIKNCEKIINAYKSGKLGQTKMPEDSNPGFTDKEKELRLCYFTLPMALNYQRDSYKMWESALKTYNDPKTKIVFDIEKCSLLNESELKENLTKYKLALQPNKHIKTWITICRTIYTNWKTMSNFINFCDNNFLILKDNIQNKYKKDFPYLSGPKIFNYWSFILKEYGKINLKNAQYIDIAPDTHITKCSVLLNVITKEDSETLTKEQINIKWRELLKDTNINPIDMHAPLWFWSKNGFQFKLD